ncbi:hypothetical protein PMI33_05125, partial [Pseudomonas sp. GM67]
MLAMAVDQAETLLTDTPPSSERR